MQAITGSNAAKGTLNSGAVLKDLTRFGQDFASDEYSKYLQQVGVQSDAYGQVANTGLDAALGVGSAGSASGQGAAQAIRGGTENQMSGLGGLVKGIGSIFGF